MRTKSKIIVSVLSVVLCLGALVCGVWAAMTTITMPLTGSVSFDTNGVAVDINAYVEGSASSTNPYKFTHYSGAHLIDETLPDWDYGTVGFASKTEPVTFVFEVSNYATSQIRVGVEVTSESADYYAVQSPAYIAASTNGTTPTTGTATLTVNLDIGEYQTRLSATELTFNVVINEYTGDGASQFNPIKISSASALNFTSNLSYELSNDITVTSTTLSVPDNVHFDGLGHTITKNTTAALFTSIGAGVTLKNFTITGTTATSTVGTNNRIGILANQTDGTSTAPINLENITTEGSVSVTLSAASYVSCFVGYSTYTNFSYCRNNASLTAAGTTQTTNYIGGMCAYLAETSNFTKCKNYGTVNIDATTGINALRIGALIGGTTVANTNIIGCYNYGDITASQTSSPVLTIHIGGIVGASSPILLQECENHGNITFEGGGQATLESPAIGGIIGTASGDFSSSSTYSYLEYNYNNGTLAASCLGTNAQARCGGIAGNANGDGLILRYNYNVGDIINSEGVGGNFLGGIVGYATSDSSPANTISINYNLGNINNSSSNISYLGGIVGDSHGYNNIETNYNAGTLTADNTSSYTAGIAGRISTSAAVSTTYISNNYFINRETYGVTDSGTGSNTGCTSMTQANMQAASFADTLNTACTSAGLTGTIFSQSSSIQNGYPYFTEIGGPEIPPAPEGSQENPYVVSDADSFQSVLTASTADTYIKVADGVTSLNVSQIPSFSGYFDGNGATITSSDNKALFGTITNATLKNFTIATAIPSQSTGTRMGTLAETSENCYIDGIRVNIMSLSLNRSGSTENLSVGGLIGYDTGSTIVNCRIGDAATTPTISTTGGRTVYVGGVVGQCSGATKIYNTFVLMNIYKSTSANVFQAYALAYGRDVVANNCVFSGTITVSSLYYAYYVGSGTAANITNCYVDSASGVYTGISGLNYMSKTDMKASSFVTTLNANAAAITDIEGIRKWETSTSSHALPVPSGDLV